MPEMLAEHTMDVRVEFHHFCVQEADDDLVPVPYPDGTAPDGRFLTAHECRVDVSSAGHTHTATLTAQIWDERPAEDTGIAWEEQGETEICSGSGTLSFVVVGGPQPETLELGVPGRRWGLRICSAGRRQVARLAPEGVPHGVEQYLLQFWPAGDG